MSDKDRISASVDKEVAEYLQQNSINASGLINELVKQHQSAGGSESAMLQLREQQLESEVANLENQLEVKRKELERVRDNLTSNKEETEDVIDEAADKLSRNDFETNTMKVSYWASEAGLTEEQLRRAIQDRWDGEQP